MDNQELITRAQLTRWWKDPVTQTVVKAFNKIAEKDKQDISNSIHETDDIVTSKNIVKLFCILKGRVEVVELLTDKEILRSVLETENLIEEIEDDTTTGI